MKRILITAALVAAAGAARAQPAMTRTGGIASPAAVPTWSIDPSGNATFGTLAGSTTVAGTPLSTVAFQAAAAAPTSALAAYAKAIGGSLTGASLDSTSTIGGVSVATLLSEIAAGSGGGVSGFAAITSGSISPTVTISGTPLSTVLGQAAAALPANDAGLAAAEANAAAAAPLTGLNAEVGRASAAEGTISTGLTTEASRAKAAEGSNASAVTSETTRATSAESANATGLTAETARATGAEGTVAGNLATETTRAKAAETAAVSGTTAEISRATGAEGSLSTNLSSEISRAEGAEGTTATGLATETSRAKTAEAAAVSGTTAETTRAEAAEGSTATGLTTETNRARTAEGLAAPQTALTTEVSRAQAAEGTITGTVTTETSRATGAEALKAPLASPALTGTPTAPTQAAGDGSTRLATDQYSDLATGAEAARAEAAEATKATTAALTSETSRATAAEGGISSVASAALPTVGLPTTPLTPSLATAARTLSARFSDTLNVRDYGAKCDGVTDDTAAIQRAINVATGAAGGPIPSVIGIGANPNGAAKVVLGSGACMHSGTLVANMGVDSSFAIVGDGTSNTQLVMTGHGDGLDINFAPNPRTSYGTGGTDLAHSAAWPGQAVFVKGINFQNGYAGINGTALSITGIQPIYANQPPASVIEDAAFSDVAGYGAVTAQSAVPSTSSWGKGLVVTNLNYLFANRVEIVDHTGLMTQGIEYQSTASASTIANYAAPGQFICQDCIQFGGQAFLDVGGYGVQTVFLERPQWHTSKLGVTWLSAADGTSGSLYVDKASGSSGTADLHATGLGTVSVQGGFWYAQGTTSGTAWHGLWYDGDSWIQSSGNTIDGPGVGALGTASAYGEVVDNLTTSGLANLPSTVAGDTAVGVDYGFRGSGPNVMLGTIQCGTGVTSCFSSDYAGGNPAYNPHWSNVQDGSNTLWADAGVAQVVGASLQHFLGGGLELGMPGVHLPGVGTGAAGTLDFHSATASTIAGLNDFDCRLAATGGLGGTSGQGGLIGTCALGLIMSGQLVDQSAPRVAIANGATVQAADNTTGIELAPGATIASGTLALPANPVNDQPFLIGAEQNITAFTLTAPSSTGGTAHYINSPPSTLTPAGPIGYRFEGAVNTWDPIVGTGTSTSSPTPIATTTSVGTVQPDGTTIGITAAGKISVIGSSGSSTPPAPDIESVAAYTVPAADCTGTLINMTNANGATVSVPSGLTSGCHFKVAQASSAGPIAITAGSSMTLPAGSSGTVYVAGAGQHTDVFVIGSEISVN